MPGLNGACGPPSAVCARKAALPPTVAMVALGEIAGALEGCGLLADGARRARLPRLVAGLADMAAEMHEAAAQAPPDDARRAGLRLVAESAGLAIRCARATLDAAHALLDDPWSLLRRWPEESGNILERLSGPEWALDGWDAIRALWRSRDTDDAMAALRDMAQLVPRHARGSRRVDRIATPLDGRKRCARACGFGAAPPPLPTDATVRLRRAPGRVDGPQRKAARPMRLSAA